LNAGTPFALSQLHFAGEVVQHDRLLGLPPCSSSSKVQIEELDSIGSPNLQAIRFADGGGVEPVRRMVDIFEGPVGGKQDTIGAHFQ
jgi:hypothetical protein